MTIEQEILNELREIKYALTYNQSDNCNADEAARIIGVSKRKLSVIHNKEKILPRRKNGTEYRYEKSDCYKVASMLRDKLITV